MSETEPADNRGTVYRLLALLWAQELTRPTQQLLSSNPVRETWLSLGGTDPLPLEKRLDELSEQFCRLFIGPVGHQPPIQSVWADGELQSEVSARLNEFAACCDYESPWSDLLPDHLANELQLMGLILEKVGLEDEPERVDAAADLAASFYESHVRWAVEFTDRVATLDDGFYGRLAGITANFLRLEEHSLRRVAEN